MSTCSKKLRVVIIIITVTYAIVCVIFKTKYKIIMPLMLFLSQLWIVSSIKPESLGDLVRKIGMPRAIASFLLVFFISCASRAESFEVMVLNAPAFVVFLIAAFCAASKNIQPPGSS